MPQAHALNFFFNLFLHICLVPWTWKIFLIKIFSAMPQAHGLKFFFKFTSSHLPTPLDLENFFDKNFLRYAPGPWTLKIFI